MCNGFNGDKYNFSARKYAQIREEFSKTLTGKSYEELYGEERAKEIKERKNKKLKGRKFSPETIEKMSAAKIGKTWEEIYGVNGKRQKNKI